MGAKPELGKNIILDNPERIEFARQRDLRDHFSWYTQAVSEIRSNPYYELSEEAIGYRVGVLQARINVLRDQIDGLPLLKREYPSHVPLDARDARRKDLFLHRRALRAGIREAREQRKYQDMYEFETRLEELEREIDLSFPI